jgi:hypothetical protein
MRRYADPVEVRQGPIDQRPPDGDPGLGTQGATDGPQQFLWRGRLWKVRAVLAHWVETGPWWQSTGARAVIGSEEAAAETTDRGHIPQRPFLGDLLTERELWRVEAGRGQLTYDGEPDGGGVFDLAFDWSDGRWTLVGCTD